MRKKMAPTGGSRALEEERREVGVEGGRVGWLAERTSRPA